MKQIFPLIVCFGIAGCGPVMEANRPDPIDLSKFTPGEKRMQVLAELGSPMSSTPDGTRSCDIYKLVTHGPDPVGKGFIAAGEVAGDIFTLGLSEVLWTPAEAMTKNGKHAVLFCYDQSGVLVSLTESKTRIN